MAIIIKCADCKARLKSDDPCPSCGGTDRRYIIDYWPDGRHGKRCQRYLDDSIKSLDVAREIDAETKLAVRDRRNPELTRDLPQYTTTIDELIPEYMEHYRLQHRSNIHPIRQERSFSEREQSLNTVSRIIGPMPIIHFNKHVAASYQLTRSKQKTKRGTEVKNRTINKELTYMMSLLSWCREKKGIDVDPKIDMLEYDRPKPIVLSPAEVIRFIKAAEEDGPFFHAFFLVLYTLGFRLSEAKYLRWKDIDRENKTVRAVQKGGDDKIGDLNKWLDAALKKLPKGKPDDYIFQIKRTGRAIDNPRRAIDRITEKAKIKKRVTPHTFRHSIATHMLAKDTNLRTIQAMLGHKDVSTTQKYTHVVTDNIRNATKDLFKEMRKASRK